MNNKVIIASAVIIFIAIKFFVAIFYITDIELHYRFVISYLTGKGTLPGNFLYYYVVSLFTSDTTKEFSGASVMVLSFSVMLKFLVVIWYLKATSKSHVADAFYIGMGIALLFITPLYIPQLAIGRFYLGSFTSTVWHNSTTIALLPFAIMLFAQTVSQLKSFTWVRFCIIIILICINAAIKPSYLFVYVGAIPFTILFTSNYKAKNLIKQTLPVIFALAVIAFQKYIIYETQSVYSANSSIDFAPFKVYAAWHSFSGWKLYLFFFASVFSAIVFPLFVCLKKGISKSNYALIFSTVSFFGAVLAFSIFSETGGRWDHGNFFWQVVPATFILFLVTVSMSVKELASPITNIRGINAYQFVFALHVIFGILYFLRIPISNTYL